MTRSIAQTPRLSALERAAAEQARRFFGLLHRPLLLGVEQIPRERPLLFVGNHTLYGLIDAPVMFLELWLEHGVFLRALGDHTHFKIPVWRDILRRYGTVDGTRENCSALMQAGASILVFPGGGREVSKRKGEAYQLIWKERLGFARLALVHGCTIVPFAAVGAEESLDIIVDADELLASPLGPVIRKVGIRPGVLLPIVRGIGPTPIPRPERLYFQFCPPITTEGFGDADDIEACRALRDRTRDTIERAIESLRELQARDPERRLGASLKRGGV